MSRVCTLSDIFPSTHAIKPLSSFTPAQCNYQSFSGARAWHLPAEGTFPLPFWRQTSRGAGQSLSAAASIASPGLWHLRRWLGTHLGTPMALELVQRACVLQKLHLLGRARANTPPNPHVPCTQISPPPALQKAICIAPGHIPTKSTLRGHGLPRQLIPSAPGIKSSLCPKSWGQGKQCQRVCASGGWEGAAASPERSVLSPNLCVAEARACIHYSRGSPQAIKCSFLKVFK